MARHSLDAVSPPSIVRATIPDATEDAILRALSKVPADRFATAVLYAEALQQPSLATGPTRRVTRPTPTARWAGLPRGMVLLGVGVVVAVTGWRVFGRGPARPGGVPAGGLDPRHIAVLYLEDLSPKKELAYLADGLTEELIAALTQVPSLSVISKNGVAPYRGAAVAPDSVARALSAGTVVQGSVEDAGTRYRVTVRLIDGASGVDFKRASFEQSAGELLVVRDSFAAPQLSDQLLRRPERAVERFHEEPALEIDDAELVAAARRHHRVLPGGAKRLWVTEASWDSNPPDPNGVPAATQAFRRADSLAAQAQALDPAWPEPLVLRAALAYRQSRLDIDPLHAGPWIDRGLGLADQALKLDPKNPPALELRGTLRYWRYLLHLVPTPAAAAETLRQAEADLRAAVTLAPSQASAWSILSHLNDQKPDYVEAKIDAQRAYEADAYLSVADQILWRLYATSYDLEQTADAIHWCAEGGRRFPEKPQFLDCQLWLMTATAVEPDGAKAWQLVDSMGKLTPARQWRLERLRAQIAVAAVLARAGLADSARRVLARSQAGAELDPERELLSFEAFARTLLGDREGALRLLTEQIAANPQHRVGLARFSHWWWRDLRDDPRFKALIGTPR